MNPIIDVHHLHHKYHDNTVLKSLSFTIGQGETVGLLGPNGAGKTTTLDLLLGIQTPSGGEIKWMGQSPKQLSKSAYESIGVQFQHSFYPAYITIKELVQMTSVLYRNPVDSVPLLEAFHLADKLRQKVSSLSGGEQQKLNVLLALIKNPDIVFLDELTTGLDPQARRDVWDILKQQKKQGTTMVLTSHYMDEVEQLCDRILVLNHGVIVFEGTTEQLKRHTNQSSLEDAYLSLIEEDSHA